MNEHLNQQKIETNMSLKKMFFFIYKVHRESNKLQNQKNFSAIKQ